MKSTTAPAKHVATPVTTHCDKRDIEAHICSDFSTGPDIHAGRRSLPSKNSYIEQGVKQLTQHPRSSPARELPKRLTRQPTFVPPVANTSGRKLGFSSPIFGRALKSTAQRCSSPCKPRPVQFSPVIRLHTGYQSVAVCT